MTNSECTRVPLAVLDACTLVPYRLSTTLLWLAEAGIFELLWSDPILDEVERSLPKLGVTPERAAHRVGAMREAFGEASLVAEFDHLIADMTCDVKDRHVLAAAVRARAELVVTFNLRDFPPDSTNGRGIEVVHPDLFLARLLADDPDRIINALQQGCNGLRKPPQTARQFLASITATVPIFANLAADQILLGSEASSGCTLPLPALALADEDEALAAFGQRGELTNPAQVAWSWWTAMVSGEDKEMRALTFSPAAWGTYEWARDMLANKSLASHVISCVDAPERIAIMRFVPKVACVSQVFDAHPTSATFLTLVRIQDRTWRVWGLGHSILAAKDVPQTE